MKDKFKEFKLSSWAVDNRTAVYILTVFITLIGLLTYINLPKEQFPEIKLPQIIVQTVYPGTSPENMENLVTKPIEKQVKNLTGVKKGNQQLLPGLFGSNSRVQHEREGGQG